MLKKFVFLFLMLTLLLAGCAAPATAVAQPTALQLVHVKLPMGYIPNIQYAPFYTAVERGYFKDAGIEVEFDYTSETDGAALVGANKLQFSLVSGEQVLMARAKGLPIVYVVAWYQQYPVSIVSMSDKNIKSPADLRGKKIGLPGLFGANYIGLRAVLYSAGIKESDVTLDSIGFAQVEALAAGHEDVVVGYAANEPVVLHSKGYAINEMRVADYVQLASNGIITNETTIAQNPALVRAFVAAFLHGLQDTITDPDAAYEISKKYVENLAQIDPLVQKQILGTSIEQWRAPILGKSDVVAWENMQKVLLDMKLYSDPLDLTKAFTNDFLPTK
ncbi:MAG: ABC transporter substrate-binding protein [Chloroflexi bacterium]|nr:ABC transporter substrate-binding protein [Chloroflexota bacterium]